MENPFPPGYALLLLCLAQSTPYTAVPFGPLRTGQTPPLSKALLSQTCTTALTSGAVRLATAAGLLTPLVAPELLLAMLVVVRLAAVAELSVPELPPPFVL
jgi:hypothetical protein